MDFLRALKLDGLKTSAFLFGPRMTGKSHLLRSLKSSLYFDLLDPEKEVELRQTPRLFWEQIRAQQKGALVIVDEIQRVPALLDYAQMGIEELGLRFILSGSSARKLKRGGANLLGGRALDLKLHPLTAEELGHKFNMAQALQYGTLPKISQLILSKDSESARRLLQSYYTTYIKEEIQAEALTRNVGAFQRFLNVAVQDNGQVIEFSNVARECSVPASTVKEYYTILEDTLLGEFLWPWDRSERKKARPKFYFFDCGVVRAIQNRLNDPPSPLELGILFETWFFRELIKHRDYGAKGHTFSFWREGNNEIDILIEGGHGPLLAIECKSGRTDIRQSTVDSFRKRFPKVPLIVASLTDQVARRLDMGVEVLPWKDSLDCYRKL
ncbi:MAG: ATP-binding protein [Elusimicrobia bacterium]|nr:ATP-binding protein [Elusimicrobiota bacterium]